jgi:ABC-type transport system substrate-binding protein
VLYTNTRPPAVAAAQLIQQELARIGIAVEIRAFPRAEQIARTDTRGEPFDMTLEGWINDYLDPFDTLNTLLDGSSLGPVNNLDVSYFNDPSYNAQVEAAAQLSGPDRFTTYGNIDVAVVRDQAPLAVLSNNNARDFFSARMGCQTFVPPYGMDLAALCINGTPDHEQGDEK